jgi:hypothetical protein
VYFLVVKRVHFYKLTPFQTELINVGFVSIGQVSNVSYSESAIMPMNIISLTMKFFSLIISSYKMAFENLYRQQISIYHLQARLFYRKLKKIYENNIKVSGDRNGPNSHNEGVIR